MDPSLKREQLRIGLCVVNRDRVDPTIPDDVGNFESNVDNQISINRELVVEEGPQSFGSHVAAAVSDTIDIRTVPYFQPNETLYAFRFGPISIAAASGARDEAFVGRVLGVSIFLRTGAFVGVGVVNQPWLGQIVYLKPL
jgi:hypothetical protein